MRAMYEVHEMVDPKVVLMVVSLGILKVDYLDCQMAAMLAAWWASSMVEHWVVQTESNSGWKMAATTVVDLDDSMVASLGV